MHVVAVLEKELGCKAIKQMLPMQPGDVPETFADIDELDAVALLGELGPVRLELLVIGEAIIVADSEAEVLLRRRDDRGRGGGRTCSD